MGYYETESPLPYEYYTFKRIATDLVTLLSSLGISKAIYIGHDWGSMIVQRVALWFPANVIAVGCICVPFARPQTNFIPLDKLVERLPNFTYQIYLSSPEAERQLSSPANIKKFLNGMFRVKGDAPVKWNSGDAILANIGYPPLSKMWETKEIWKFYVRSFQRTGSLGGPLTYYKTRELNFKDELELEGKERIQCPAMFIGATSDQALPPAMWENQQWVPQLERYTVDAGHWCLIEGGGKQAGKIIQNWVSKISKPTSKL
jgi:soluble epoxide hydrolase/lipid-phosphate phosphatase